MFRFQSPIWFILLLLLPAIGFWKARRGATARLRVSSVDTLSLLSGGVWLHLRRAMPILRILSLTLLITSLARPQWWIKQVSVKTEGINIVVAVDVSESMAALDFKRRGKIVNRLEAIKGVIESFVSRRDGDRIGMVVFGTHAFTQLPLTRDYAALTFVLDRLQIGSAGKNTAIGDAIGISLKRLSDIESDANIIILLTDGQSNAGELSPDAAARIAADQQVKIYTIGVGTRGKAPYLVKHPVFGEQYVYQQVDIDEKTLTAIAEKTGGMYFRAQDTEALEAIYRTIDQLEKTEVEVETFAEYRDLYRYTLVPALMLMLLAVLLTQTRLLRIP
ncbi:MAG: magnesium chelatase [Deltaproteobacteria bacterium]|nr:MAG: magnesium chelatase [Deltaproteobacteria bacterium]